MTKSLNDLETVYYKHRYDFDKNYHTIEYCYANYFYIQYKIDYESFDEPIEKTTLYKYFMYNFTEATHSDYHNICVLSIFNTFKKMENMNLYLLNNIFKQVCKINLTIDHNNKTYLFQLMDTENNKNIFENEISITSHSETEFSNNNSEIEFEDNNSETEFEDNNSEIEFEDRINNIEKSMNIIYDTLFEPEPVNIYQEIKSILFKIFLFLVTYFFLIYNIIVINDYNIKEYSKNEYR